MIYSLTESSGFFSPEFLDETIMENSSLVGYNTITILPTVKKNGILICSRLRTNDKNGKE